MIYFVGTPIGNRKDITLRALEILKSVEYIACEDTRTSSVLLSMYDIHTKLISYHKFNEREVASKIANDAKQKDIAVISDAGLPAISDPGYILIKELQQQNIPFTVVAGPSAVTNAFILSGMPAPFTFIGFLPDKNKDRIKLLDSFKQVPSSLIFYVSPHHLEKDMVDMYTVLGDRKVAVIREITKLYEEVTHTTLKEGYQGVVKGEFVLVVEKNNEEQKPLGSIEEQLKKYQEQGYLKVDAIKKVAKDNEIKKNEVYQVALKIENWK